MARGSEGAFDALALYEAPLSVLEEAEYFLSVLSDPETKARLAALRAERERHARLAHGN